MTPTDEQREYNTYLLEIMRHCGLFKCTDCLYALWEDRGLGLDCKCCHPQTLPDSAWNDLETVMRGSACDVFEPSGNAAHNVVERMSATSEGVLKLWDYANRKTDWTPMHDTADERQVRAAMFAIEKEGMVRI